MSVDPVYAVYISRNGQKGNAGIIGGHMADANKIGMVSPDFCKNEFGNSKIALFPREFLWHLRMKGKHHG